MAEDETQARAVKEGFVKSPRQVEYELFGPNSPYPEKWRVFNFIKYRIQDNKRRSQSERISREYIIENTGIWENHFSRIIKDLQVADLIEVEKGHYRDSVATYRLSPRRFFMGVIVPDSDQKPDVDKSANAGDKSAPQNVDNTKMVGENDPKHQNGVTKHQNGVETTLSSMELLTEISSRSLLNRTRETKIPRTPEVGAGCFNVLGEGRGNAEKFGLSPEVFRKLSIQWSKEGGHPEFGEWLQTRGGLG